MILFKKSCHSAKDTTTLTTLFIIFVLVLNACLCADQNLFQDSKNNNNDDEDQYDLSEADNESSGYGEEISSSNELLSKNGGEVKRPLYGKPNEQNPDIVEKKSQETQPKPAQIQTQQQQQQQSKQQQQSSSKTDNTQYEEYEPNNDYDDPEYDTEKDDNKKGNQANDENIKDENTLVNNDQQATTISSQPDQVTYQSSGSKLLVIITKPGILAGIVGGAIIGVLTAILLIMFIVYRMRKKDEGSYALEETKKPLNAYDYRNCPTREFYA